MTAVVHQVAPGIQPRCFGVGTAAPMDSARDLFAYQQDGVEFLATRRVGFLFDAMGLGKSAQAIRAADAIGAKRLLIICPAIARTNWQRELAKFGLLTRNVQVVVSATQTIDPDAEVIIISYDLAARPEVRRQLVVRRFDVLIADEAQALKGRAARRTRAVYGARCDGQGGLVACAARVWLLTGTPMPNHAGEIWTQLNALLPEAITIGSKRLTHTEFVDRYCVTRPTPYGPKVVGNRNAAELRHRLQPHVLRRRAEDVLRDLPPIRFTTTVLDAGEALADLAATAASPELALLRSVLDAAVASSELHAGGVDRDGLIERALRIESIALARLRRLTGLAKANATVDLLRDEFTSGALQKVAVFAHHREVLHTLATGLARYGVVAIDGSTSPARRQDAIDRFQTDPGTRVFIGQITAASTAITLTTASHVVFAEASWVPADNLQAAKRCHRIGQTRPVLARFISLAGSLDEAITEVLRRKTRLLAELID